METALFEKKYEYGHEPIADLAAVRFHVAIVTYEQHHGAHRDVIRRWDNLRFDLLSKYQWYFRHVAAKFQLTNPCKTIYFSYYRTVVGDTINAERKQIQDKIINLKGRITKDKNNLQKAQDAWNQLFPIEQDPQYQKAIQTITSKEDRLKSLEFQLSTIPQK